MMRYVRAAIGLMAAIAVAVLFHSLMTPRLAEGAYGAGGGIGGWLTFAVDILAFGGTWVSVVGLLASRTVSGLFSRVLEGTGHGETPAKPSPPVREKPAANSEPVYAEDDEEDWNESEQLAGMSALKCLKDADAEGYLRAFRLLHPGHDHDLQAAIPTAPAVETPPKPRTTKGK